MFRVVMKVNIISFVLRTGLLAARIFNHIP